MTKMDNRFVQRMDESSDTPSSRVRRATYIAVSSLAVGLSLVAGNGVLIVASVFQLLAAVLAAAIVHFSRRRRRVPSKSNR
jgi:hypothetical protein